MISEEITAVSLFHLPYENSYRAKVRWRQKGVQKGTIQAVDFNQPSVLSSISTVGNLANDPPGKERQKWKRWNYKGRVNPLSRLGSLSQPLIHTGGDFVQDLDPTQE